MSSPGQNLTGLPKLVSFSALSAGIIGVIVSLYVPNAYDVTIPPLLILGVLLGLLVSNVDSTDHDRVSLNREWLLIAYFTVAGAAVLAYVAAFNRSVTVNVLLVCLYLLSGAGILVFESPWAKLAAPIGTAALQRGFIYYASATQLGLDALFHNQAANALDATGTLTALSTSKYWYTSGYHLLTGASTTVFGIGVRDAAFVSVTLVMLVVMPVSIFTVLRRDWGATVAATGAFLFLVAGRSITNAVHTTPTTLGLVFTILLLLFLVPFLATGRRHYLAAAGLAVAGLAFTHQLSLFIALVTLSLFAFVYTLLREPGQRAWSRPLLFTGMVGAAFLIQTFVTKYDGPRGERSTSFFMEVAPEILNGLLAPLQSGEGRTASYPPGYAVSGADALSVIQVFGQALLFCFAVVGTIYWLSQRRESHSTVMGLGGMVVVISAVVFGGALIGTNAFLPRRWIGFLVIPLSLLAAPGIMAMVGRVTARRERALAVVAVFLLITAPYVVFMFGNGVGSPDGPVFDDAPGATRITTTATEAQLYQFVDGHAGNSTVVADHLAWQVIERHYGQRARVYRVQYSERDTTYSGERLIVYREYASTKHASFDVVYQGDVVRVYAPLPGPQAGDSTVYSSGRDRLVYRPSRG